MSMDMGDRLRLWAEADQACMPHAKALDYTGNCYEVAYRIAMAGGVAARDGRVWRLCHGLVEGGGKRHGHAWVEADGWALEFSNGESVVVPADVYRRLGKVTDVQEYEWHEAAAASVRERHFGPWHHDGDLEPLDSGAGPEPLDDEGGG